jgi:aldehyde:ferredoxin oxidoreductase
MAEEGSYSLRIIRVNLTTASVSEERVDGDTARKYIGGTGLATKYLWEEVPALVKWSDPENRIMFFTGPLAGTRVSGSGTFSVTTKGACTNMAGTSQANGFLGAFMRFNGIDGIIVEGAAKTWTRIHIHDGTVDLVNAEHLIGKDTWETEDTVKEEIGKKCSVFSIGPSGERLVRFSAIVGDHGHVAAHNGVGAVMGSKKLKCLSVERGQVKPRVVNPERLSTVAKELAALSKQVDPGLVKFGTNFGFVVLGPMGAVPVKNYTTNHFPEIVNFVGEYLRSHFKMKPAPCWACAIAHCQMVEVTEGPYKGFVGEEPEYEGMAAMGPVIGQTDPGAAIMLANLVDRMGLDINESGYMIGWIMECYEKGILKKGDLDGLEMNWGNVEGAATMLRKIANREGCGNLFAEGVKRSAEKLGGEAAACAVYTLKGASPRGHDHRAHWMEFIDTCLSNTGTVETGGQSFTPPNLGLTPVKDRFDPMAMSTQNAKLNGGRDFEDSLGVCRLCTPNLKLTVDCLNAVTGWEYTIADAQATGLRIVNQMRMFNFRHGLTKEIEGPSERYASTPVDGPAEGKSIRIHWDAIRNNYYEQMGWDVETGKPLPETLRKLGLEHLVKDLNA